MSRPGVLALLAVVMVSSGCSDNSSSTGDKVPAVVPIPVELELRDGRAFRVNAETVIGFSPDDEETRAVASQLHAILSAALPELAAPSPIDTADAQTTNAILLEVADADASDESYTIDSDETQVRARAHSAHGLFNAAQTIRQLLPANIERATASDGPLTLPAAHIADAPRFGWRGLMLDVSRTFLPKSYILATIDRLALYKMNVLHLHLTDDQGWRLESEAFPELHERGSQWSEDYPDEVPGYYTKADIAEIIAYARARFIEVIPEIDMPGHVIALLHARPELACALGGDARTSEEFPIVPYSKGPGIHDEVLCVCNPEIYPTLFAILDEAIELFPSEYVHLGGDEAPTGEWERSEECASMVTAGTLADISEAQAYFARRMQAHLTEQGKRMIGWTEVLSNERAAGPRHALDDSFTTMHWLAQDAPPEGLFDRDVIQSPIFEYYLDWYESTDLEGVYAYEPEPEGLSEEELEHLLGAQGNMWMGFETSRSVERADIHVYPKLLAIAESTWSPRERKDWSDFATRVEAHGERLERLGVAPGPCVDCVF